MLANSCLHLSHLLFHLIVSGFGKDLLHDLIKDYQGSDYEASPPLSKTSFIYILFLLCWSAEDASHDIMHVALLCAYKLSDDLGSLSSFLPLTSELPSLLSRSMKGWSVPGCSRQQSNGAKTWRAKRGDVLFLRQRCIFSEISSLLPLPTGLNLHILLPNIVKSFS